MESEKKSRRDFLIQCARFITFAGIASLSGVLLKKCIARKGETCIHMGICRGCSSFSDCRLPQALSAKRVLGK